MAADRQRCMKLMVTYGGRIERAQGRPPRYVGGEHLLLNVVSSVSPRGFRDQLAARTGFSDFSVKYCYSGEGLDSLCDVDTDEDLRDMLDLVLYRDLQVRLFNDLNTRRFRVYLFRDAAAAAAPSPTPRALGKPTPMRRSATSPALLPAKSTDVAPVRRIGTSPNMLWETMTAGAAPSKPPLAPALLPAKPTGVAPVRRIATSPNTSWETPTAGAAPSKPPLAPALLPAKPTDVAPVRRIATSPNTLWETSTAGAAPSKPPLAPAPPRRIASSSLLAADSTDAAASLTTTTSTSAARATQHTPRHAAAFRQAEQSNPVPVCHAAPVFLVPVMPQVIIHQPTIILVPAFSSKVAMG